MPDTSECQQTMQMALERSKLGVPVAEQKTEGMAKVIAFLGIEVVH